MQHRILLFAGTTEGRLITEHLAGKNVSLDVSVATAYGGELLPAADNIRIMQQRLDEGEMRALLRSDGYSLVLDATHPYAQEVTENIQKACREQGLRCIRILRSAEDPGTVGTAPVHIKYADTTEEAVRMLHDTTGPVFLTTGSKTLPQFMQLPNAADRIFARILPSPEMLQQALDFGLPGSHITCAQGPFSVESNLAATQAVRQRWTGEHPDFADAPLTLVTKESGQAGGYSEKLEAAAQVSADVIVIRRPQEKADVQECMTLGQTLSLLDELCGQTPIESRLSSEAQCLSASDPQQSPREVFLIGCGMSASQLTLEADAAIRSCDLIIGAKRLLEMSAHYEKPVLCSYDYEKITKHLVENAQIRRAAVLFSGDIGLYSGASKLRECLAPYKNSFRITALSGISSPVHFLNQLGKHYEDIPVVSLHGQSTSVISHLRTQGQLLVLLGKEDDIPSLCWAFLGVGMEDVRLTVGSCLQSPEESIVCGSPKELADRCFPPLSVVFLEYPRALQEPVVHGLPDDVFIRGQVPMTKSEIRSIILSKLQLTRKAIFFDIGSGTGSIAVEAARMIPEGKVYAIERNPEALDLITNNAMRLQADCLVTVPGTAPENLPEHTVPTHAFIGGSGGKMHEILAALLEINPQVRIVATAITVETLLTLQNANKTLPLPEPEIIQVQISRSKKAGSSHLMQALNPVYIVTFSPSTSPNKEDPS